MGMKSGEALSLLAMIALLIAPWFIVGLHIWGWLFVCISLTVLGFEGYSYFKYGKTISQIFWAFKKKHPISAWIVFLITSIGWIILGVHLLNK